MINGFISTCV